MAPSLLAALANRLQTGSARKVPEAGPGSNGDEHEETLIQQFKAVNFGNLRTLQELAVSGLTGKEVDDKLYLMERIVQLAAELPVTSTSSATLTHGFLGQLWKDLQHPPQSYLGSQYMFRQADGSNNNIMWPHIGVAGAPYARSVKPEMMQPAARPDAGLIFDSVMVRKNFREHPNKISSVLFYLASVIIHDIFHTNHEDFSKSDTSSYLDLAPLYGSSVEDQNSVRTMRDGKLKADCFADKRILGFPPGVGVLLIMFNRFHNHVVEHLAAIDERKRFSSIRHPPGRRRPLDADSLYDEALFQTGRLVTTGLYINCVLKDYVRTILNLNRVESKWNLDPRSAEGRELFGDKIPEGTGNQVSAEFNLVYRWHSCISERDEQWSIKAFDAITGPKKNLSQGDFLLALRKWNEALPKDPQDFPFDDLQRLPSGHFDDNDLATIWTASVEDVAGDFGANHVPEVLRGVEILGIMQARSWNLASLNEFRKYFKLKPHKTFEDMNPDIAEDLKNLYGEVDNVELYPGIVLESTKETKVPGSGLCTTFTISRAILSDAVALVRGDRFYTIDYSPSNLTNWGFHAADYDLNVNNGCVFYKLVLCALPNNYQHDSIYAHFPMVVPGENFKILTNLKQNSYYNFERPQTIRPAVMSSSHKACTAIVRDPVTFKRTGVEWLLKNIQKDHLTSHQSRTANPEFLDQALLGASPDDVKRFSGDIAHALLQQHAHRLAAVNRVDVVREIGNAGSVHLAASIFSLPLRNNGNTEGLYDAHQLHLLLSRLYTGMIGESRGDHLFQVRQQANEVIKPVGDWMQSVVGSTKRSGVLTEMIGSLHIHHGTDLTDSGGYLIQQLLKNGFTPEEVAWCHLLPAAARLVVALSRMFAQCLSFYLGRGQQHLQLIMDLAKDGNPKSDEQLEHYVLEGIRLTMAHKTSRVAARATSVNGQDQLLPVEAGQQVRCDLVSASRDESVFPEPDNVILDRAVELYSFAFEECIEPVLARSCIVAMIKEVWKLPGLKRSAGPQGHLRAVEQPGSSQYMNSDESDFTPSPTSMYIEWDA